MPKIAASHRQVQDSYSALAGKVLMHAGDNARAAELGAYADGIVVHGSPGFQLAPDLTLVHPVLIDPDRYSRDRGKPRPQELFPETMAESAAAQVSSCASCLFAPSRFPDDRTDGSLRAELARGVDFVVAANALAPSKPCFVPIVVRHDELADGRWVPLVREADVPFATVFAARGDPLGTPAQIEGAISLLQVNVSMTLRCDMSAIGLMALGALTGAIGASSAVRHLWLPSKKRGNTPASASLFVPRATNWMKTTFVRQAQADPDLDELFGCDCPVCGPNGDVRHLLLANVDTSLVDRHSVAAVVKSAHSVLDAGDPVDAWLEKCSQASLAYATLAELGITGPKEPASLKAWRDVLG
jgi:hypothetical protein